MIEIKAIKTDKGYYITRDDGDKSYHRYNFPNFLYFDGELATKSFDSNWGFIKNIPTKIIRKESQPHTNHRFELKDKTFASEKLPEILNYDDAVYGKNDDDDDYCGCFRWKPEYKDFSSLYEYKYDTQSPIDVEEEFTFEIILEVDGDLNKPTNKYNLKFGYDNIQHQMLDKIIFPQVVIHERPSKVDSKTMFNIVRDYAKQNIDTTYAKVTSDYDFHFAVKKVIPLAEPYTIKQAILKSNGKPYANPRYNEKYIKDREVEILNIVPKGNDYRGVMIPEFEADNEDELQDKVYEYCKKIIEIINEPVAECPHCNGRGVVNINIVDVNKVI